MARWPIFKFGEKQRISNLEEESLTQQSELHRRKPFIVAGSLLAWNPGVYLSEWDRRYVEGAL
jgi:hypothetical protein